LVSATSHIEPSVIPTAKGRFPRSAGIKSSSAPVNAAAITGSDAQIEIQYPHATMNPAKSPYADRV
jgi:shikimate kinase